MSFGCWSGWLSSEVSHQQSEAIRNRNFPGKALDQWAYRNGVQLKLMEHGKPSQNAYIESFNGRIGDECLNDHWLTRLADARTRIAARLPSASAAERTALPDTGRICSQLAAKIAQ